MKKQIQLLVCVLTTIFLAGCGQQLQSTVTGNTATPFVSIPPEPTRTPLQRTKEIISLDYGQTLELYIGDIFILDKLPEDNSPTIIGNESVLQRLPKSNGTNRNQERYEAMAAGTSVLCSIVSIPCHNAPVGCQPPTKFVYVTVIVSAP